MSSLRGSLRKMPFALTALFAVVGCIAALAYAINAWQVFGFARHVWKLPIQLCFGAAVVADALSLAGLFATYLLRNAPKRVRAYAWAVFLSMTGLSIAAAESFASWRRLTPAERIHGQSPDAMIAAASIVVALALAAHMLIIAKRYVVVPDEVDMTAVERVAGVPVEMQGRGRQPGVYRAIGATPMPPLYIGSTIDFAARVQAHKAGSEWFSDVVRWTFEPYPTLDDALVAERALIEAEQPTYNRRHRDASAPIKSKRLPAGTVVDTRPPTVDVASVPSRRRSRTGEYVPDRGKSGGDRSRRDAFAARVISGERAADIAKEADIGKRSVELWVKSYRERHPESNGAPATDVSTSTEPQVNGHEFHPDGRPSPSTASGTSASASPTIGPSRSCPCCSRP
jgi:hypothetical protein